MVVSERKSRTWYPLGWVLTAVLGCGATPTHFANQLLNADGRPIILEDVETILNDDGLDDDAKRGQLRDLGILDEQLISALLGV